MIQHFRLFHLFHSLLRYLYFEIYFLVLDDIKSAYRRLERVSKGEELEESAEQAKRARIASKKYSEDYEIGEPSKDKASELKASENVVLPDEGNARVPLVAKSKNTGTKSGKSVAEKGK